MLNAVDTIVEHLPVSLIDPGLSVANDRTVFAQDALAVLAASIQANGLAQPITVRRCGNRFSIVAGERRFRAVRDILQWDTIPAMVRELTDSEAAAVMRCENTARVQLNPVEEAYAYQKRIDTYGWTVDQVAESAGVCKTTVQKRLALLTLREEILHLLAHDQLSLGHAECMTALDRNRQLSALRILQESKRHLTVAEFRVITQALYGEQQQDNLFSLENLLIEQVQQLKPKKGKGVQIPVMLPQEPSTPLSDDALMARFLNRLVAKGKHLEANLISTLYDGLDQQSTRPSTKRPKQVTLLHSLSPIGKG